MSLHVNDIQEKPSDWEPLNITKLGKYLPVLFFKNRFTCIFPRIFLMNIHMILNSKIKRPYLYCMYSECLQCCVNMCMLQCHLLQEVVSKKSLRELKEVSMQQIKTGPFHFKLSIRVDS